MTEEITQPFAEGTAGSECFRIPSLTVLNDGSVLAACDIRYSHSHDSPENLETLVAFSPDGRNDWRYTVINHFEDYPDGYSSKKSASFIDPATVQSKQTGRIFVLTDAFPSGYGSARSKNGVGYLSIGGYYYLALTKSRNIDNFSKFNYYLGEFKDGFADIISTDGTPTKYSADTEYYIYKNGNPLTMKQPKTKKIIHQNLFFNKSKFSVYGTTYLWLRYSDDYGETWSEPVILNPMVKDDNESFLGCCPGKGLTVNIDGNERIIFFVYDNSTGKERTSTIYSDDNGLTWSRGVPSECDSKLKKTSETQGVVMPDGTIRAFARTYSPYVGTAVSNFGEEFTKFTQLDKNKVTKDCLVSFVPWHDNMSDTDMILGSFGTGRGRENGVIRLYRILDDGSLEAIKDIVLNNCFFAYSCMAVLPDNKVAILYEEEHYGKITYRIVDITNPEMIII